MFFIGSIIVFWKSLARVAVRLCAFFYGHLAVREW
nr:MAG TPA: hypothetical protein [Caudoviricetes sp.]